MGLSPDPHRQEVSDGKLTSSLMTLIREVAKNPGLLDSWEDLKIRTPNLDLMDRL